MTRLQNLIILVAAISLVVVAGGLCVVLLIALPPWFKPLAAVPLVFYFRYGTGSSWVESGCSVLVVVVVAIALISFFCLVAR